MHHADKAAFGPLFSTLYATSATRHIVKNFARMAPNYIRIFTQINEWSIFSEFHDKTGQNVELLLNFIELLLNWK
jgi:hypothetical protein